MATNPKVLNKYKGVPSTNWVYIGRPSKYGNPFSHMDDTTAEFKASSRLDAISKYAKMMSDRIKRDPEVLRELQEDLRGKDLVCWCSPNPCHGDVLLKLANM